MNAGDVITITAVFNETVLVTSAPTLTINVGGTDRSAVYNSGAGTNSLKFNYTISNSDSADTDGISINANAIDQMQLMGVFFL